MDSFAKLEKTKIKKKRIQTEIREKLGLIIDVPKPKSGNSNDGNTARYFFANYAMASEITRVSEDMIRRFGVVLQTLASGRKINSADFGKYAHLLKFS
jgi:hypothetical protein